MCTLKLLDPSPRCRRRAPSPFCVASRFRFAAVRRSEKLSSQLVRRPTFSSISKINEESLFVFIIAVTSNVISSHLHLIERRRRREGEEMDDKQTDMALTLLPAVSRAPPVGGINYASEANGDADKWSDA